MVLFIECVVCIILFTLVVVPKCIADPVGSLCDYPPAIRQRCVELGIIKQTDRRLTPKNILHKGLAVVVLVALLTFVLIKVNHAQTFLQGFLYSLVIWLAVTWYDALILDCIWFCHSKRVRIPGTEDMKKEYGDCMFHIIQSCTGTLIGLPACALIGLLVMLFSK